VDDACQKGSGAAKLTTSSGSS